MSEETSARKTVELDPVALVVLFETALTNPRVGMKVLNSLRAAQNMGEYPSNYIPGDLTRPHDSEWRSALMGFQLALEMSTP